MNILVTGGTGFIGSALCARLQAEGHRVKVLSRDPARAQSRFLGQAEIIGSLDALGQDDAPEAIVNLAGENLAGHRWNARWREEFVRSRVGMTERVVDYIARAPRKPRVLVSGSAVGYYGARGDEALTEDSAPGREYQSDLCVAWEQAACKAEKHGVRVCRLRTGIVLGPNGGALRSMLPPFRFGLGGHLGDGRQWMSWIHLDDEIGLILHLLRDDSLQGAFNGTAPEPVTNREFARSLGTALHRPVLMPLPGFLVRVLVGEMAHLLLTGQKVLPERSQRAGYRFRYPRLPQAFEEILGAR